MARKKASAAGGFLRKLLGGAPELPPDVVQAQEELTRLAQRQPSVERPCAALHALLPVLFGRPVEGPAPGLTAEQAAAKLEVGLPLLRGEALPLDAAWLRQRWLE